MEKTGKKIVRIFGIVFASVFVACFLFIAALPLLLSSSFGKKFLLSSLEKKTSLSWQVDSLSLHWLSSQDFQGIEISDAQKRPLFSCPHIQIESSLWKILWDRDVGKVTISSPTMALRREEGVSKETSSEPLETPKNVASEPVSSGKTKNKSTPFILSGSLLLENGSMQIFNHEDLTVSFRDIFVNAELPQSAAQTFSVKMQANTEEQNVQGSIDILVKGSNLLSSTPSLQADVSGKNLPLVGIEKIVSIVDPKMQGWLTEGFGDRLNIELHASSSPDNLLMNVSLSSPQFQANIATKAIDGGITLENPAIISWQPSSIFLQKMVEKFPSSLAVKTTPKFQIQLQKLLIPTSSGTIEFANTSFAASLDTTPSLLSLSAGKDSVEIQKVSMNLSSDKLQEKVTYTSQINLSYNKLPCTFALSGSCNQPLDTNLTELIFSLSADNLPTRLFEQDENKQILVKALGDTVQCKIDGTLSMDKSDIELQAKTTFFQLPSLHLAVQNKVLVLSSPASFTYAASPLLVQTLTGSQILSKEASFTGTFSKVEIPLQQMEKSKCSFGLQCIELPLTALFPLSPDAIAPLNCSIEVNSLHDIAFSLSASRLQASFFFALKDNMDKIVFTKPLQVHVQLQPSELESFLKNSTLHPKILNSPSIDLEIAPFTYSLSQTEQGVFPIGQIKCDKIALENPSDQTPVSLENTLIAFQLGSTDSSFSLKAAVKSGEKEAGTIFTDCKISGGQLFPQMNLSDASCTGHFQCKNIASSFLDSWMGTRNSLQETIGPTLQVDSSFTSNRDKQSLDLKVTSQNINVACSVFVKDRILQIDKSPASVDILLTPSSYVFLTNSLEKVEGFPPFTLTESSKISFTISQLQIPVTSEEKGMISPVMDISSLAWKAQATIDKLSFEDKENEEFIGLQNVSIKSQKPQNSSLLQLQVDGVSSTKSAQGGSISVNASVSLPKDKQNWSIADLETSCNITLKQFPVAILDILPLHPKDDGFSFVQLIGNTLHMNLQAQIAQKSGPIDFTMHSPQIRASLHGSLDNGVLHLRESIFAQVTLDKKLGTFLMKDSKISSISSDHPLTLEIGAEGFSLPLFPFDPSQMQIPGARIELGQVLCENVGNLSATLKILKSNQLSKSKNLQLWFMPIDLHIKNGIANIERTEVLVADTYEIALWGEVNVVNNKVNMILGLTAQALYQAFGISKLPDNYVLQIPVTGTLPDVELSTTIATTKVAALLAWQNQELLGGLGGKAAPLFGELLGALATLPDKDSPTPPAKKPFPWQTPTASPKKEGGKIPKKRTKIKKSDSAGKQLFKVLK